MRLPLRGDNQQWRGRSPERASYLQRLRRRRSDGAAPTFWGDESDRARGASFLRVVRLSVAAARCPRWREGRSALAAGSEYRPALANCRCCDRVELLCGSECACAGVAPVAARGEPTAAGERAGE
jgi:hypothetical protein